MEQFKKGDQIIYVPTHAEGNLDHSDVQAGFVTSVKTTTEGEVIVFCRYWRNRKCEALRTRANSEGCDPKYLLHHNNVRQQNVDYLLRLIDEGERLPDL